MKEVYIAIAALLLFSSAFLLKGYLGGGETDNADRAADGEGAVGLANPASTYCVDQGYRIEIKTDSDGNQYGVCVFPDGSSCDEWAFFRGECSP